MKTLFLIIASTLAISFSNNFFSQKPSKVKLEYIFTHIIDGYDHKTKTEVYIDGVKITESEPHLQSVPTQLTFSITKGRHDIKIENYAFYNNQWEKRSVETGYSLNGTIQKTMVFKKKKSIKITFDIDKTEPDVIEK